MLKTRNAVATATTVSSVLKRTSFVPRPAERNRDHGHRWTPVPEAGARAASASSRPTAHRLGQRNGEVQERLLPRVDPHPAGHEPRPLVPGGGGVLARR